jgi:GntR family transcriptional regulator
MGGVVIQDGPVPKWQQIADIYRRKIASGELRPGDRVPSIRSISQEYGVALTTAQKVIEGLKSEGLIRTSATGSWVIDPSEEGGQSESADTLRQQRPPHIHRPH